MNWFIVFVCLLSAACSTLGSLIENREAGRFFTHLGIIILAVLIAVYGGTNW